MWRLGSKRAVSWLKKRSALKAGRFYLLASCLRLFEVMAELEEEETVVVEPEKEEEARCLRRS